MVQVFIKILFKVISKIAIAAAGEKVVEYCIFWLLGEAVKTTKTKFDDELLEKIKNEYGKKGGAGAIPTPD